VLNHKRTDKKCRLCSNIVLNVDPKAREVYCWECVSNGTYVNFKTSGVAKASIDLFAEEDLVNKPTRRSTMSVMKDKDGKCKGNYIGEFLKKGMSLPEIVKEVLKIFPDENPDKLYRYVCVRRSKLKKLNK